MNKNRAQLLFSLRRLPGEFADVEKTSRYLGAAGLFVSAVLFRRNLVGFIVVSFVVFFLGRFVALALHDRNVGLKGKSASQTIQTIVIATITVSVGVCAAAVLYWSLTTREAVFVLESIIGIATLTWFAGIWRARFVLGLFDIGLVALSTAMFVLVGSAGFIAAGAYAAFIAWALLFGNQRQQKESATC